jgi:serine protease Do
MPAMKLVKILGVLVALSGIAALSLAVARPAFAQSGAVVAHPDDQGRHDEESHGRRLTMLRGPLLGWGGAEIGVSARDLRPSDPQTRTHEGVVIEEVQPDSPASKAGLQRSDIVVSFDGERVRSLRQFSRLVSETAAGRTVTATVLRDGQQKDLQVTPEERTATTFEIDTDKLRDRLGDIGRYIDRLPPMNFDFDFDVPTDVPSRGRLGITAAPLGDQLADYFGAKDGGVLVAAVTDDSPASRAGLHAGDVIASVNGTPVRSPGELVRALRDARDRDPITLGVVRDRKARTVTLSVR